MRLKLQRGVFFSVAHRPFKVTSVRPYYDMSVGWDQWAPYRSSEYVLFYNDVLKENHGQKASPPLDCSWCVCVDNIYEYSQNWCKKCVCVFVCVCVNVVHKIEATQLLNLSRRIGICTVSTVCCKIMRNGLNILKNLKSISDTHKKYLDIEWTLQYFKGS